jgi:hypothetical protein
MENTMEAEFKLRDKANLLGWLKTDFSTNERTDSIISKALLTLSSIPTSNPAEEDIARFGEIGIPSITLSGVQRDWELLVQKLDRLEGLGEQPAAYSRGLRPILNRFVATF